MMNELEFSRINAEKLSDLLDEDNNLIYSTTCVSGDKYINGRNLCLNMSDEEIERIADKFNSIGCTSFQMTADELKEILGKQEKKEYAIDERLTNNFFSSDFGRPLKITFEGDLKDE